MRVFKLTDSAFFVLAIVCSLIATGCASAKKKTVPELNKLEGKKVALIEVQGEETARKIVEVALVNQLIKNGTFILLPKQDVDAARVSVDQDSTDWKGVAKRAGAEVALRARVLKFDATTSEGYSSEIVDDSQMAEERGEDARKVEQLYKVKAMKGDVQVELQFATLSDGDIRYAVAEYQEEVKAEGNKGGIHLPPKLGFLEKLTNEAFARFFHKYN